MHIELVRKLSNNSTNQIMVILHVKNSINVIHQYKYLIKSTQAQLQNSDASFHSPPTHESAYINVKHLMNIMHPNIKVSLNKANSAMYNKDIKYNSYKRFA